MNLLHKTKVHLDSSRRTRLRLEFGAVREKLRMLDQDIPVLNLCLDSAHNNYATYGICKEWGICLYTPMPRGHHPHPKTPKKVSR